MRIAAELGLNAERQRLMHRTALLHDIGKLSVPNSILDKPGKLNVTNNARSAVISCWPHGA